MAVKPVPDGYSTYTPYYVVEGAAEFIEFLKKAFGAEELFRMPVPGGRIGHAEVRIGNSMVMLGDAGGEHPARQFNAMIYVNDADGVFKTAVAAGAKIERPLENQFYGDRMGGVVDRWGNHWMIGTHVEDVSPEEMKRRMAAMQKK
ncbi:MAG TPA: VOC family protein [Myxococcales bacterium]